MCRYVSSKLGKKQILDFFRQWRINITWNVNGLALAVIGFISFENIVGDDVNHIIRQYWVLSPKIHM